jgi:hypothetical protein
MVALAREFFAPPEREEAAIDIINPRISGI